MNELLYPMIFKRKSFHVFKSYLPLLQEDLEEIKKSVQSVYTAYSRHKSKNANCSQRRNDL